MIETVLLKIGRRCQETNHGKALRPHGGFHRYCLETSGRMKLSSLAMTFCLSHVCPVWTFQVVAHYYKGCFLSVRCWWEPCGCAGKSSVYSTSPVVNTWNCPSEQPSHLS